MWDFEVDGGYFVLFLMQLSETVLKAHLAPLGRLAHFYFPQDSWLQLIQLMSLVWEQFSTNEMHSTSVSWLAEQYVLKLFGLDLL